jgi:hypothetical protein
MSGSRCFDTKQWPCHDRNNAINTSIIQHVAKLIGDPMGALHPGIPHHFGTVNKWTGRCAPSLLTRRSVAIGQVDLGLECTDVGGFSL